MNRKFSALIAAAMLCPLAATAASAEIISFDGTVSAKETVQVYAPIGGTVDSVSLEAGETVKAGDVLVTLKTTKVYASEAGTVTGIFGQPGDSAETVSSRYGAVMYIEGEHAFTLSASTDNAYNSTATKYVHVGESVYVVSRSSSTHCGNGVITAVSGTSYTVEMNDGTFETGESCDIYRGSSAVTTKRIGRGTTARVNPTAVTASGSIVSYAVKDGDKVTRGQLLMETLDGSFDGLYMSGNEIYADTDGVVGSVSAQAGSSVQKNSVVAVIYPAGSMEIQGSVAESDLAYIHEGDTVEIEMNWNPDDDQVLTGTVSKISSIGTSNNGSTTYTVTIDFTADSSVRYGMTCTVSTIEADAAQGGAADGTQE